MSSIIDPCQFKALMMLRDNWQSIRDECAALDRNDVLETERGDLTHIEAARMLAANGRAQWMKAWGLNKDRWLTWGFAIDDQYPLGRRGAEHREPAASRFRLVKVAALSLFRPGGTVWAQERPSPLHHTRHARHASFHARKARPVLSLVRRIQSVKRSDATPIAPGVQPG